MSSRFWTMHQFTAPFRGRRVPSPDHSPTSTPCDKGAFGVLRIPLHSTIDPLRSGLRLAPRGDAAGVGLVLTLIRVFATLEELMDPVIECHAAGCAFALACERPSARIDHIAGPQHRRSVTRPA
jgi:hypothetical protein